MTSLFPIPLSIISDVSSNKVGKEQSEQDCVVQWQEMCIEDATVLANDLKNISKHGLLDSSMLEKVQMTHESFKRLSSSDMPIYEHVEKQGKRGKNKNKLKYPLLPL